MHRRGIPNVPPSADDYILIPPRLYALLCAIFRFADFDPCPYPRPSWFDGLTLCWPDRTFINPPFTRKYGMKTAFIRKAIAENAKGKTIFGIISTQGGHPINLLLEAGAELYPVGENGRVAWIGINTGQPMPGPVPTVFFILNAPRAPQKGRPKVWHRPMTPAERQARRRALLKVAELGLLDVTKLRVS
jgi:hypothetical protein